jgi:hypothetical protein
MTEKNVQKMIPCFVRTGRPVKTPLNGHETAHKRRKRRGRAKFVVLCAKAILGAFKRVRGLLKVIRVQKLIVIIGDGVR